MVYLLTEIHTAVSLDRTEGSAFSWEPPNRLSQTQAARKDEHMPIQTKAIGYRDGDTELTGFLAWDDAGKDRRPRILVVHGGAGLDNHAMGRARRLAELGLYRICLRHVRQWRCRESRTGDRKNNGTTE